MCEIGGFAPPKLYSNARTCGHRTTNKWSVKKTCINSTLSNKKIRTKLWLQETDHRKKLSKQTKKDMAMKDMFAQIGSIIASVMFIWAIFQQYCPYQLRSNIQKYSQRLVNLVYPYIQITFNEFAGERLVRSEAYSAIKTYLSSNSSMQVKRLKADIGKNSQSLALSMDDDEEVADEFQGVKLWWASGKNISKTQSFTFYPITDEKRYYKFIFHKRHRDLVLRPYLNYVLKEGKAIKVRNMQRTLYTNNGS